MSMPLMTTIDPPRLAQWAKGSKRSALEEMLPIISQPGIISFALGVPALELFPLEEYMQATNRVLATTRDRALQYQPPLQSLKKHVVRLMVERGVTCTEDQIFLTAGAQQGMCLLARLLLDHGGQVLLEERI
jgi:2-aminoadipate transaminase